MMAVPAAIPAATMDRRHMDAYNNGGAAAGGLPQTPPSANISPTNLYSHLHVRQLRPQKQALYTPACLRPTEAARPKNIPDRPRAPDTPPQSKESSFDSVRSGARADGIAGQYVASPINSPDIQFPEFDPFNDPELDITGPPTSAHWKPDSSSSSCTVCKTPFTWYFRRHHCRRCGDLVCASHFLHTVPLDQNARLHSQGVPSKACDPCYTEWKKLKLLRHSRANSLAQSSDSSQQTPLAIPRQASKPTMPIVGSMARSEGGMVWSTF